MASAMAHEPTGSMFREAVNVRNAAGLFNAMIVVDAVALSFWLADRISTPQILLLHVAGALACWCVAALFQRQAMLPLLIEAGLCIFAGPLGGLVLRMTQVGRPVGNAALSLGELPFHADSDPPPQLPDVIYDLKQQGRRATLQQSGELHYADILRNGDLTRHNEVIAAISRNYHPEMYPALSFALGSSSPALKVQAAAVYSKLRRTFGESANALLKTDLNALAPEDAASCHAEILRVAKSGFVDTEKGQALMALAAAIEAKGIFSSGTASAAPSARGFRYLQPDIRKRGPRLKRYSCGGLG